MSSLLKVCLGFVVLLALVAGYLFLQSNVGHIDEARTDLTPTTRPVDRSPDVGGIGSGERPWANQYDDEGRLSYQFRADQYTPRDATTVLVSQPVIRFFLTGGQVVQLEGKSGTVYLPRQAGSGGGAGGAGGGTGTSPKGFAGPTGLPSRGNIKDVTIRIFESEDAPEATVVATMDNVAFDNDTLRIATEAYNDGTRDIPADQVPVTVRGKDVDFDGQGLIIRINQRDRTIQSLEVVRGTRMVIRNAAMVDTVSKPTAAASSSTGTQPLATGPTPQAPVTSPAAVRAPPGSVPMVPSAGNPPEAAPMPASLAPDQSDIFYRITLRNKVHIVQGDATTVDGDILQLDYNMPRRRPPPSAGSAAPGAVPGQASAAPAGAAGPTASPGTDGAQAKSRFDPVVVTWDGPLRLLAGAGDPTTPPRQSVLTVFGTPKAPVVLVQGKSKAHAAAVKYETRIRTATLTGRDGQPVLLEDDRGSVVTTPKLTYDFPARHVKMFGTTVVRSSTDKDEAGRPRVMICTWSEQADLQFSSQARGAPKIQTALLRGDVNVEHPQLSLKSRSLELTFDPAAKNPKDRQATSAAATAAAGDAEALGSASSSLRKVFAQGGVAARIFNPKSSDNGPSAASTGPTPGLTGDTLTVFTVPNERGRLFASRIESTGNVQASDGKQLLNADNLAMDLAPERRGQTLGVSNSKVQTLFATGNVRALAEDQSLATADKLTVTEANSKPRLLLEGPSASVESADKTTRLAAPVIDYTTADEIARIPVAGTLAGIQKAARPGDPDTRYTVSWSDSALFNPGGNRLDVAGNVRFQSVDKSGALSTATGKSLVVHLADAPPSKDSAQQTVQQPVQQATARGPGSSAPTPGSESVPGARLIGRKAMKSVDLSGDVKVESVLGDSRGNLLHQYSLLADKVTFDAAGNFLCPVPGRLLLVDKNADPVARDRSNDVLPSGRGTTAISWRDSLAYDPATRNITFLGNAIFVHQALAPADFDRAPHPSQALPSAPGLRPDDEIFRLEADRMVATLASNRPGPGVPAANDLQSSQLRSVSADGAVYFQGRGLSARASHIDFDPREQVVVARGKDRIPVVVDDERAVGTGRFDSARLNLRTGQIEDLTNPTGNIGVGNLRSRK